MSNLIKKILVISSASFLGIVILVISILWFFSNKLPDYKFLKNYKAPVSSKVYSGEGELVNDFSSEKRIFVPPANSSIQPLQMLFVLFPNRPKQQI